MKKVGIVSCYFKNNYGSILQAYALTKYLDNNNIPNETIKIDDNIDFKKGKRKYYMGQIFNFNFIKSKFGMIKLKIDKKIVKNLNNNISIRNEKYNEFRKEFNLTKPYNNYSSLNKIAKEKYTDIIVGSDQLWLPVNVVADYYTLNWVPNNINKISYSTSYGISSIPSKYIDLYKKFLKRINHLSVREEDAIKITKEIANIKPKLVCDPTLLLTKNEWEQEINKERLIEEKYILCYFLGSNIEHRKFAEKLKNKTGYKIVSINHADEYVKYSDKFADIIPYDIGPREWLNLIKNAEYICTDSFHGTIFSIIFNKIFFDFRRYNKNIKSSTNSRIDSLLNTLGINNERIIKKTEKIDKVLDYKIDYDKVNKNIEIFRNNSREWLLNSITWKPKEEKKYIEVTKKELCSGCTACASVCPKKAITMKRDKEGFLYPHVDINKCINCGLCKKICPILNKKETKKFNQKGYIFQYNNSKIRKESTSGGAFTAIAEYIINQKGVVYGVGFNDEFKVKHQRITKEEEIKKFRNSKYVQSDPNSSFKEAEKDLKEGLLVCFSGTPCQIEGLKSFLRKDYENLITVDVVCRAVPSPLLWEKYIENKNKNQSITKAYFREKYYGYKYSNLTLYDNDKLVYNNGIDTDPYLRAFFSNIACRPSCYNCHFKKQLHKADFTIWDCFEVDEFSKEFDDDLGTTRVLINSEKGIEIFDKIKEKHKYKEIPVDRLVNNFYQMFNSIKENPKRELFLNDLNEKNIEELMNIYFPNTLKCKIEKYLRITLIKLRIYKPILKLAKKIRKRD